MISKVTLVALPNIHRSLQWCHLSDWNCFPAVTNHPSRNWLVTRVVTHAVVKGGLWFCCWFPINIINHREKSRSTANYQIEPLAQILVESFSLSHQGQAAPFATAIAPASSVSFFLRCRRLRGTSCNRHWDIQYLDALGADQNLQNIFRFHRNP